MPWEVRCLLEEHEVLSLNAQHPCKSLVWRLYIYNLSTGGGGQGEVDPICVQVCVTEKKIDMKSNFRINNGSLK